MKKIVVLLLVAIMVLSFAACQPKAEAPAEQPKEEAATAPAPAEEAPEEEAAAPAGVFKVGFYTVKVNRKT